MTKSELERDEDFAALMADLEARRLLCPAPEDLPRLGALVRRPDCSVGEVVGWLSTNPGGRRAISHLRVALVEVTDSALEQMSDSPLQKNRVGTEDSLVVLRAEPSSTFLTKWLARVEGRIH